MSVPSQESVYQLIPEAPPPQRRPPRHKSKFGEKVKNETKQNKAPSKTMGPAKVPVNSPKQYLLKHSKETKLPEKTVRQSNAISPKPSVPLHDDRPQMGAKSTRDFVKTNAISNIMTVPKKPAAKYVDSATGAAHSLETSGLVPKYCQKQDYGKVPVYLEQRRKEMAEAQEDYDRYVAESLRRGQMQRVQQEEREVLLAGLKKNWEELHHQYQGLSVVTDTAPKKARKERMEAEMKQLEKDIELVERHKAIYIAQEQPQFAY